MLLRLSSSILFPYTTLFRSKFELISGERRLRAAKKAGLERIPAFVRDADTEEMLEMALVENVQRDRKSTRLNSSHVANSYAVFCLKKQNTNASLNSSHQINN